VILTLIIVALLLFLLELFLPGGILAIIGFICILVATYLGYDAYGPTAAALIFIGAIMLSVLSFVIELKLLKNTTVGKFLRSNSAVEAASVEPQSDQDIVGQRGTALTTMAPSGRVRVNERNYEASSLGGYVEKKNAQVEVVRVESFKLIVKPL
ncbi:MAG: NfeD family protein, partial [Verrucomicrobiota bacterium]